MKKIITVGFALCFAISAGAQTIYDAAKLTDRDLNGTARFVGMGGAMGALGGDITTMGTNPAGIGIFRSSDVMTSFSYSAYGTKSDYVGTVMNKNNGRWSFDNIGFVFASKIGNQTALRFVNFGFNYKRSKSFYKNMTLEGMMGTFDKNLLSQANLMAQQATNANWGNKENYNFNGVDAYDNNNLGWLGIIGYQGFLTNLDTNGSYGIYRPVVPKEAEILFNSNERGGVDQYDFNIAFNVKDRAYFGVTIGAYGVNYEKRSFHDENYGNAEGYLLESTNRIKGSGVDAKFGAIVRPFESSSFRIGLAVHTPVYYQLTYENRASLTSDVFITKKTVDGKVHEYRERDPEKYPKSTTRVPIDANGGKSIQQDVRLRTPWKYNVSMGYTVGSTLALGAEYEREDYTTMKFSYTDGYEMIDENSTVKDFMKGVHTLRVGAEYKVIPQFAFRLGYNYSTTAFKEDVACKWLPVNAIFTDTDFANSSSQHHYTIGIGYRGSSFYADLAYQYATYKEKFYPFYNELQSVDGDWFVVTPEVTNVTNTRSQVLLTLGMRF